ncbi:asparagine synthase (glutamine-hydrolyzing) [Nodularia spumigena CS-588/02]|uniref:asparagine synthase (glutamine-hydrolyzing) n=1 Tax=Nodularia spumigena TaxID=70799 RepID=UPI00232DCEA5|nr:asparagine synthase (glutamine-hydrolyzing) [Nodularia spumigena]MDB9359760.1 asparagine synthase (glutamine-hydrolyzing) [Nodularia spumigena CS-588/02]MDB9365108.1 asparagine synthase (glutamine-hydrolyzing) [Nodularia spumigena CS-588/02A10]
MCGIVGIVNFKNPSDQQISHLVRMTKSLRHRGPDDEGYVIFEDDGTVHNYCGEDTPQTVRNSLPELQFAETVKGISSVVALGHRRLSIIDLSVGGHQPMSYLNKRYWIVFNGEIYNYIELREQLKIDGYSFGSNSDTEVILAAYDRWGTDCLSRFNGMWSFVIYDRQNKIFFIARDRFGIKPLYYFKNENTFIFASEIKALIQHPDVTVSPNIDYLKMYLNHGAKEYIKETAFENIYKFPFASYLHCDAGSLINELHPEVFWRLKPNLESESFCQNKANILAKEYYDLLEDAVRIRLRSDVRIGSALSGGLDSSSIVYLVNQQLKAMGKEELQETFSSVYKSDKTRYCDESHFINILAQLLRVNSNQIEPQEQDVPKEHEKVIWYMENPPENTCMSNWHTFKKVSQTNVKVTLDGQGADEQLAGYFLYFPNYLCSLPLFETYREMLKIIRLPGSNRFIFQAFLIVHFKLIFGVDLLTRLFRFIKKRNLELNLNQLLADDIQTRLITLIHYADSVSMAHSIESRMPFMDYRLVEFLAGVPACYKIHNGWTKYLARLAFDKKLPDEICWRKDKMGWPIPEKHWFAGGLKDWLVDEIESSDLVLRVTGSKLDINKSLNSNSLFVKLMRVLNISVFEKKFFIGKLKT